MKNDVNGAIAKGIMAFIREEVSREDLMERSRLFAGRNQCNDWLNPSR